jgi:selenobiotic family peptide radical SAM maturase
MSENLADIYPFCWSFIGSEEYESVPAGTEGDTGPDSFSAFILSTVPSFPLKSYLPDLAQIEWAVFQAGDPQHDLKQLPTVLQVNPTLSLLETSWPGLADCYNKDTIADVALEQGEEIVLVWRDPQTAVIHVQSATKGDLLALKIVAEELDLLAVSRTEDIAISILEGVVDRAAARGLLLKPRSQLVRDPNLFAPEHKPPERYLAARVFTLQWHITQACDLSCRHCYDRSSRSQVTLPAGLAILDDMAAFCRDRNVAGQITFTGGNPLLHPDFLDLYQAALDRGLMTAILGNPTGKDVLEQICAVGKPEFYQVSLEGLQEHNDHIRGSGHFERALAFLEFLRDMDIYAMVMLTLTRDNMDQVLPLAERLQRLADGFFFNRLSMVGEGANLQTPSREEYRGFLDRFLAAAAANPVIGLKDNLINIVLEGDNRELFGGCAGYGCGAAFNFFSLLPDGEVHACRKFPSPIGNINENSLGKIYDSSEALRYRQGPSECLGCRIRHVCGGCLAVTHSHGLNVFQDRDPCCFINDPN